MWTNPNPNPTAFRSRHVLRLHGLTRTVLCIHQGVWAVHFRAPDRDIPTLDGARLHEYLVLSMPDATMVLKSGETLAEVTEQCEFVKTASTLSVGNLFDFARIAQVQHQALSRVDKPFTLLRSSFMTWNPHL